MGVRERRARQRKFLRQEILDAASELFVRNGFENVSMRSIADKIEYSPTAIYHYFRDRPSYWTKFVRRRLPDSSMSFRKSWHSISCVARYEPVVDATGPGRVTCAKSRAATFN